MLRVHFLPKQQHSLTGVIAPTTVAVIDLLRASTTLCYAVAAGVSELRIFGTVQEAMQAKKQAVQAGTKSAILLGGERKGEKLPEFQLGNSPAEYTSKKLSEKSLYFTSTNGAQALLGYPSATNIIVAAAVNFSAVCSYLGEQQINHRSKIEIVCAGTDGAVTREDILLAGAICEKLTSQNAEISLLDDSALIARAAWREVAARALQKSLSLSVCFAEELQNTLGGKNLLDIGHSKDLVACAEFDRFRCVPTFNSKTATISCP